MYKLSGLGIVWLELQLPKLHLNSYREFLLSKYSRQYAILQYGYVKRYAHLMGNPRELQNIPPSIRGNVMKSLINLSKYLGKYESFKAQLKNYGVKWVTTDNSFNSFLRIVNNNHSNLDEWYAKALEALRDNEKLWLRFCLLTGLRKQESLDSFNLIIKLAKEGNLSEYWNRELGILGHFKYRKLFLRNTKNVYISIIAEELINDIANSKLVSNQAIRKRISRNKLPLRVKELRSYFATYLRRSGIISEYIDLLQGRIPKSVFARHYLKVDDFKALVSQVLVVTRKLENSLLS